MQPLWVGQGAKVNNNRITKNLKERYLKGGRTDQSGSCPDSKHLLHPTPSSLFSPPKSYHHNINSEFAIEKLSGWFSYSMMGSFSQQLKT